MRNIKKNIDFVVMLCVWIILLLMFWISDWTGNMAGNEMGYGLLAFYLIQPLVALVCGIRCGKHAGIRKWIFVLLTGVSSFLLDVCTFRLFSMIACHKPITVYIETTLYGLIPGLAGVLLGMIYKKITCGKKAKPST